MATSVFVSAPGSLSAMAQIMSQQQRELAIHRQQISYFDQSNVDFTVDRMYSTVHIADVAEPVAGVFLQDHEADTFIEQADALFEHGNLSMSECYKVIAYPYLDGLM
jgi:hypothetical protein